ncbi:MAG: hypothetical protein K0M58_13165 [Thiobacillus sp.]|nr:hypothetical protein [Thiobacillus sp.]
MGMKGFKHWVLGGGRPSTRCGSRRKARAMAGYIAGMTDRYAMREHRRIFAVQEISG